MTERVSEGEKETQRERGTERETVCHTETKREPLG